MGCARRRKETNQENMQNYRGNRRMLGESMMENETPIIYSTTHNEIIKDDSTCKFNPRYTIENEEDDSSNNSSSVERYYHYYITSSQSQGFQWNQDLFVTQYQQNYQVEYDGHEDTLDDYYNEKTGESCIEPRRYRRRSTNSISFTEDAKNGINSLSSQPLNKYVEINNCDRNDIKHLKWLVS